MGRHKILPEKILSVRPKSGYPCVPLNKGGGQYRVAVHRLVATYFVENDDPENKTEVNHLDRDLLNYAKGNLEWCTRSHNVKFGSNEKYRNDYLKSIGREDLISMDKPTENSDCEK